MKPTLKDRIALWILTLPWVVKFFQYPIYEFSKAAARLAVEDLKKEIASKRQVDRIIKLKNDPAHPDKLRIVKIYGREKVAEKELPAPKTAIGKLFG